MKHLGWEGGSSCTSYNSPHATGWALSLSIGREATVGKVKLFAQGHSSEGSAHSRRLKRSREGHLSELVNGGHMV